MGDDSVESFGLTGLAMWFIVSQGSNLVNNGVLFKFVLLAPQAITNHL